MNQVVNSIITGVNGIGQGFWDYAASLFVQSSVLVVLLLLVDFLLRKRVRAVFRYCVWMLVFVKLLLPTSFALPTGIGYWLRDYWPSEPSVQEEVLDIEQAAPAVVPPERVVPWEEKVIASGAPVDEMVPVGPVTSAASDDLEPVKIRLEPIRWQGLVFLSWLVGMLVLSVLLVQRAWFVKGLLAQATEADGRLLDLLGRCRGDAGVKERVRLKLSANMVSPAVCGLFGPTILLPRYLVKKLSAEKLRAVLIHELAHIKRRDIWVNLAQTVLQIVYFYNPFVWLANAMVRRVREQAVDEMVLVALGKEADGYSDTLIDIGEMAFWRPNLSLRLIGVVESKKALAARIKHIVSRTTPKSAKVGIIGFVAVAVIGAVLLPMSRAERSTLNGSELLSRLRQFDAVYESGLTASAFSPGEAKNYRPMGSWGAGLPDRILPPIPKNWKLVMAGERCMLVIKSVEVPLSTFRPVALTDEEADAERGRPGVEAEDMTFWGPDYTAKFEVHRCYSRENNEVKVIGQGGGGFTFFLPDDTSRNRPLKQFLWSMGRGYSKYIYELNRVVELEDGTIRCSGPGTDSPHDKDPARWELVVDTAANYMVRSAKFTELGDDKPAYEITASGTKVMNGRIVPETATWQESRDGRTQTPMRFVFHRVTKEPDYKLLRATEKAMFGPYEDGARVRDERIVPLFSRRFKPGEKYKPAFPIMRQTLVGRPLEGLQAFDLELDDNQTRNKMILACFWDMDQRPSRHFIKQLAKKAEEFEPEGVIIVAVHASKVEKKVLNEWLTKNKIAFPVGIVKEDWEKTCHEWAVKSLPWLILADRNRTVIAEGFGLEELAGNIKESKGGEPAGSGEAGLGRAAAGSAEGKQPTVSELLDRYAQTQDKLKSYIAKTKCTIAWDNLFTNNNRHLTGKGVEFELREFRTDGSRAYTSELTWGHRPSGKQLVREGAYYKSHMWDGQLYWAGRSADGSCFADHAKIFKGRGARDNGRVLVCKGDVLNDYEGLERMDHLLRKAMEGGRKVSVLGRRQKVGRFSCYVIEAQMKDGPTYKLWLDPGHGYQIAKTESREVGDGKRYPEGLIIYSSMQVLGFKKIDGLWVPMEVETEAGRTTRGGDYFKRKIHVERTDFVLDPDHKALGSFVPKGVANGAEVNISGVEGIDDNIDYIWQDGEVVDSRGYRISLDPNDAGYKPALLGKVLPPFGRFGLKLGPSRFRDRKILVCFFDMNQRPSRHCVRELAKRADELKVKSVGVVCVQASRVDRKELDKWVKKYEIPFPVGMLEGDEKKIRFRWGAKALPWLILTDAEHIVRAEGFALDELEEKLSTTSSEMTKVEGKGEEAWSETVEGLRCRWVGSKGPVVVGDKPVLSIEVENVSGKRIFWECRDGFTLNFDKPDSTGGRMPRFKVRLGQGAREATAGEIQKYFGTALSGYYCLESGARMTITSTYPWPLTKAGPTKIKAHLLRTNLGGIDFPYPKGLILCPPLVVEVVALIASWGEAAEAEQTQLRTETDTTSSASSVTEELASLPEILRIVYDCEKRRSCYIDFDTGRLFSIPNQLHDNADALADWCREKGIDAGVNWRDSGKLGLSGIDLRASAVEADMWGRNMGHVRRKLQTMRLHKNLFMQYDGPGSTYVFKTREGTLGILNIKSHGRESVGHFLRIRYKSPIIKGVVLSGRVLSEPGGQGVEGVPLVLQTGLGLGLYANTDADGRYSFVPVEADVKNRSMNIWVVQEAQPRGTWCPGARVRVADEDVPVGDICLTLPQSISGTVRDESTGRPVGEGVRIQIHKASVPMNYLTTDAQGRYRFYVPPGNYTLLCRGSEERYYPIPGERKEADEQMVGVAAGQVIDDVDFVVRSAPKFNGTVVMPDGRPAAGAEVFVHVRWNPDPTKPFTINGVIARKFNQVRLETDADGQFVGYLRRPDMPEREGDEIITIRAVARLRDGSMSGIALAKTTESRGLSSPIRIVLSESGTATFSLAEPDGQPIANAFVHAEFSSNRGWIRAEHLADLIQDLGKGDYKVRGLIPQSQYKLEFYAERAYKTGGSQPFKVQSGEQIDLGTFTLKTNLRNM